MNEADVIDIAREALIVMLRMGGPILLLGLLTGVVVSLIQTVTSIQEATLSFVPKLLVVSLAVLLLFPFMISSLTGFTEMLFDRIAAFGHA